MVAVSNAYDPYAAERRVKAFINWFIEDTGAAGNATPSATNPEPISDLTQMLDHGRQAGAKWATMEPGMWVLDGTWDILPDDLTGVDIGYWSSALSGTGGTFATSPTLTFALSAPASSAGFELGFDGEAHEWPTSVRIDVYNSSNTRIATQTVAVTGWRMQVDLSVENYTRVAFTFLRTFGPMRRVRAYYVLFGLGQYLDQSTLVGATWTYGTAADGTKFPNREIVFTIDNQEKRYNLVNPAGIFRFLQLGQPVETALAIDGNRVDCGSFFFRLAEADDSALTATVTAVDRSYWLDTETYTGQSGTWTVSAALEAVIGSAWDVEADAAVLSRTIRRCIPENTKKRDAVRMIAQAARCGCFVNRAGKLVLMDMSGGDPVDALTSDELYSMSGIKQTERVDGVVLKVSDSFAETENEFTAGSGTSIKTVDNPLVNPADGQAVADWLLSVFKRQLSFNLSTRGNPVTELGDTVAVATAFGTTTEAVITDIQLKYEGGGLTAGVKGIQKEVGG